MPAGFVPFSQFCEMHSHKKWKDSLEGDLDQELFVAKFESSKMPVPMQPQNTSNVNINCPENQSNCIHYND